MSKSNMDIFFEKIAEGFQQDTRQFIFTLIVIMLFILIPLIIFLIRRVLIRMRRIKDARALFFQLIQKKNLSSRDEHLLKAMAARCRKDKPRLPLLLSDVHFFAKYAHFLARKKQGTHTELALLRQHLGLHYRTLPVELYSTAEFVRGMPLRLTFASAGRCRVMLEQVEERGLLIPAKLRPQPDEEVLIEFARQAGYYRIQSRVVVVNARDIVLAHSEEIARVQKRQYFRTRLKLPVTLKLPGNPTPVPVQLAELSGGGARLILEGIRLRPEQEVELILNPLRGEAMHIPARVLRLTPGQKGCSLAFRIEREAQRDRIIRFMQQGKKTRRVAVAGE